MCPASVAGRRKIGTNLFLFGGVRDSANHDVLLLVDITDPFNPVLTPFPVSSPITRMVVAGNVLHTTSRAGYAAYSIPGVTSGPGILTGSCNEPVTWTLNPPSGQGTITAGGLYTAPASISGTQSVTLTATGQNDGAQATAVISLSNTLTLTMTSATPGPSLVGTAATFVATVTNGASAPVSGITVTLTVTGANAQTKSSVTGSNGQAIFTYTGTVRGTDSLQSSSGSFTSNTLSVNWINPVNPITTTAANAKFFTATNCASGCEAFATPTTQTPVFTQIFPDILFTGNTRPFTDTVVDSSGATVGTIVAQGLGSQAGVGTLLGFSAVFTGNFVVTGGQLHHQRHQPGWLHLRRWQWRHTRQRYQCESAGGEHFLAIPHHGSE